MIKRLAQICGASAVVWSLGMGVVSAVYQPAEANAQFTCYFCACSERGCVCEQVPCP